MKISNFFEENFSSYANYDSFRSIGSFLDGFKPTARKLIATADTQKINEPMKLSSFVNKMSDTCLHPNTKILIDNELIKVKDLLNKTFNIQSFNEKTKIFETDLCEIVYVSSSSNEFIEIEMENGSTFKVTPNHKILTKEGIWKRADELTLEDELMSIFE